MRRRSDRAVSPSPTHQGLLSGPCSIPYPSCPQGSASSSEKWRTDTNVTITTMLTTKTPTPTSTNSAYGPTTATKLTHRIVSTYHSERTVCQQALCRSVTEIEWLPWERPYPRRLPRPNHQASARTCANNHFPTSPAIPAPFWHAPSGCIVSVSHLGGPTH